MPSDRDLSPEWREIIRKLIVRRILLDLSQRAAAELAGLRQHQISDFELGKRVPTAETLIRLVGAYGLQLILTSSPEPGGSA